MTTTADIYEIVYNELDLTDAQMSRRAYLRPSDFQPLNTADAATNTSSHANLNTTLDRSMPRLYYLGLNESSDNNRPPVNPRESWISDTTILSTSNNYSTWVHSTTQESITLDEDISPVSPQMEPEMIEISDDEDIPEQPQASPEISLLTIPAFESTPIGGFTLTTRRDVMKSLKQIREPLQRRGLSQPTRVCGACGQELPKRFPESGFSSEDDYYELEESY